MPASVVFLAAGAEASVAVAVAVGAGFVGLVTGADWCVWLVITGGGLTPIDGRAHENSTSPAQTARAKPMGGEWCDDDKAMKLQNLWEKKLFRTLP